MDKNSILKRIDELLAMSASVQAPTSVATELVQGTTSLMTQAYGANSTQLNMFRKTVESLQKSPSTIIDLWRASKGALKNLKAEIESGLIESLRRQITGDVLTDFLRLARAALDQSGDGAKNVAAVLTAAAYEDTLRRMGATLAGVMGDPDLADVLNELKVKGVIGSPQIGIAQSYLSFRNHALHANWDKIQRESVHSVLGFVEQLLLKHFA